MNEYFSKAWYPLDVQSMKNVARTYAARVLKINVLTFCLLKVLPKCCVSIRKSSVWFYINSSVQ